MMNKMMNDVWVNLKSEFLRKKSQKLELKVGFWEGKKIRNLILKSDFESEKVRNLSSKTEFWGGKKFGFWFLKSEFLMKKVRNLSLKWDFECEKKIRKKVWIQNFFVKNQKSEKEIKLRVIKGINSEERKVTIQIVKKAKNLRKKSKLKA